VFHIRAQRRPRNLSWVAYPRARRVSPTLGKAEKGWVEFADDALLLMTFDTHLVMADDNEGVEGDVRAEGSAEVPFGEIVTLARLGEKLLIVRVSEVE
jgi:hypothetical protein